MPGYSTPPAAQRVTAHIVSILVTLWQRFLSVPSHRFDGMKRIGFVGRSRDDLKSFPKQIMQLAGYQLFLMQTGDTPATAKPMPRIGKGCIELVINGAGTWFRILVAPTVDPTTIWVLHCFQKKTNATPAADIRLGQTRYRQIK